MRLYHNSKSSNARRVLMTALHLGADLELVEINLMSPDDRRRLEELNPNSKIPVLEDGGFVLWESAAIMQYLADRTPGQTLYPQNVRDRADVNRWLFWTCQHFAPALSVFTWENVWKKMVTGAAADPAELARAEQDLAPLAALLDGHLARRTWLVGHDVTLADYAIAASLMYVERARVPLSRYPHIAAWLGRVRQLDAWKKTDPTW
ncbi:glutathione S-transferase family protein [Pseudoduganella armeniaca]|uniref:Glutathione S-transferase family protein n=1 Tax=Pseudoduganella armeniaca TaxID=2072590 RepID=A0A2R4C5G0_9BURK|nr:glutathione S-transferase family protein [Pseudoduganella armeniaca]AVR94844.1 glutathione S-transferase family protein [Pseudoduganella armeniaca]